MMVVMMMRVIIVRAIVVIVVVMVVMMGIIVILRHFYVRFPLRFRFGACGVRPVNGLQQGDRIRDRLEQL